MSHFTVLVTNTHNKSHDEQLVRFYEQGEPDDYFMEWNDLTEEYREEYENGTASEYYPSRGEVPQTEFKKLEALKVGQVTVIEINNKLYQTGYEKGHKYFAYNSDESPDEKICFEVEEVFPNPGSNGAHNDTVYEGKVQVRIIDAPRQIPLKEKYTDYNLYLKDYHGEDNPEKQGYWHNPDAKWDWYSVGGRWAGFFKKKAGAEGIRGSDGVMGAHLSEDGVDIVKIKDIDWEAMAEAEKERRAKHWDEEMAKEDVKQRFWWDENRDNVIKMTREEYINRPVHNSTFAVLHDDEWYERGSMGWWGIVSDGKEHEVWDEEFTKLIQNLDPEAEVTIVDCHI